MKEKDEIKQMNEIINKIDIIKDQDWQQKEGETEEEYNRRIEEVENDIYMSTAKTINVDRGYYYRVVANHIAGDVYPYEETASFTDGILIN